MEPDDEGEMEGWRTEMLEEFRKMLLGQAHEILQKMCEDGGIKEQTLIADSDAMVMGKLEFKFPEPICVLLPEIADIVINQMRAIMLMMLSDEAFAATVCLLTKMLANGMLESDMMGLDDDHQVQDDIEKKFRSMLN